MEEMVTLERALELIDDRSQPLEAESVELIFAAGRVLAETANAWVDLPNCPISLVDGYALRSQDTAGASPSRPRRLKILGASQLGAPFEDIMPPETCVRVVSGAVIPGESDAVIADERVKAAGGGIEVTAESAAGDGVRGKAEEFRVGELIAEEGTVLSPGHISLLIAAGWQNVKTVRPPRVRVIAAGDELKSPGRALEPGEVFPSVAGGIVSWCRMMGAGEVRLNLVLDDPDDIMEELPDHHSADLVITLGGTGHSEQDVMIRALMERDVNILFQGVAVRPGHFTSFGLIAERVPVLVLPGGPSAAEAMFQLLGRRLISALMGSPVRDLPLQTVRLAEPVKAGEDFDRLVRVKFVDDEGGLLARPLGRLPVHRSIAEADGLLFVPRNEEYPAGELVAAWRTR